MEIDSNSLVLNAESKQTERPFWKIILELKVFFHLKKPTTYSIREGYQGQTNEKFEIEENFAEQNVCEAHEFSK